MLTTVECRLRYGAYNSGIIWWICTCNVVVKQVKTLNGFSGTFGPLNRKHFTNTLRERITVSDWSRETTVFVVVRGEEVSHLLWLLVITDYSGFLAYVVRHEYCCLIVDDLIRHSKAMLSSYIF